MRTLLSLYVFALAVFASPNARAAEIQGSNIALSDYPGPTCIKPTRPKPDSNAMPSAGAGLPGLSGFNQDGNKTYNVLVEVYNSCMRTYVDNANADLKRIQDRVQSAIAQANAP